MKKNKKFILTGLAALILFAAILLILKSAKVFEKDEWTISQYGPRDINSSFYTLYNPKKGLIVVDGGWTEDAEYVRSAIALFGNKVDAWILTHPHADHIGAFNEIYSDLQEIEIDKIYTVDMASPEDCIAVASWDKVDAYRDFLALEIPELEYVALGDKLTICDLKFEILSAYGKHVKELSRDYINDGSMMFKVTGKKESMLFCADVGSSVSDYLLDYWEDEIDVDYLQMGHHGFGGLKDDFYEMTTPKKAFFDAPDWMMKDTTGAYDNPENVKLMESLGSEVVSFSSAPNSIILE